MDLSPCLFGAHVTSGSSIEEEEDQVPYLKCRENKGICHARENERSRRRSKVRTCVLPRVFPSYVLIYVSKRVIELAAGAQKKNRNG